MKRSHGSDSGASGLQAQSTALGDSTGNPVLTPVGQRECADSGQLTETESADFEQYRVRLRQIAKTWIEVGEALRDIRERRLYRVQFRSFEAFCREELGMGRANVNRLLQSTQVASLVATIVANPVREAHVRPLLCLSNPQAQIAAFSRALERAGKDNKPLTGAYVARAVRETNANVSARPPALGLQKGDVLTRLLRGLARGLEALAVEQLEALEEALGQFKSEWLKMNLVKAKPHAAGEDLV